MTGSNQHKELRVEIGRAVYSPDYSGGRNLPPRIYLDDGKRVCPTCNGKGINPVLPHRVCPKCDGEKRIPHPRRMGRGF